VLTHEIMNSAIPISNLTGMIYETVLDEEQQFRDLKKLDPENQEELITSLQTIQNRSRGLVDFVNSTRSITRLPQPRTYEINIVDVLHRVFSLFSQKLKQRNIQYQIEHIEDKILIQGDAEQLERVFINVLQNAVEALEGMENPQITVELEKHSSENITISITDNGKGMTREESENLFIPFYTTKKEGTGIGLTLSRQIIHNHNGEMNVESLDGKGTKFIVTL
jgi:signal transduction histidine kinase